MTADFPGRGPAPRSVLLLQGPAGPFFRRLATALAARGHAVHKVNFNLGDALFWRGSGAIAYRGRAAAWPARCEALLRRYNITDLVLFGDCRKLHRAAIAAAIRLGIRVLVAEEGYLRPDWITFEPHGVNGYSTLPRTADWYLREAAALPTGAGVPAPDSFLRRAVQDVLYHLASTAGRLAYPFYRTHRPWPALLEYAGWLWRLANLPAADRRSGRRSTWLAQSAQPYFLYPLQLDCDFQIRVHSPFAGQDAAIARVFGSFARWAPPACLLVVKQHPLENGLRNWRARLARAAAQAGLADRVVFLESGELAPLVAAARGLVTVNSTSGMVALAQGVPVHTLGTAIYDLPGLTSQGTLERFWRAPVKPDPALFAAFRAVLIARCLVPGGLYSLQGLDLAVAGAVFRLEHAPPSEVPPSEASALPTPVQARPVASADSLVAA